MKLLLNKCWNLLLHNIAIAKIFDRGKFVTSAGNFCIAAPGNLVEMKKKIVEVFKCLKVLNDFSKGITVIDPFFIFSTYKNLTLIKLDNPDYFPPLSDVDVT